MHKLSYLFILCSIAFLSAQNSDSEIDLTRYPQGYLMETLSGLGLAGNVLSDPGMISGSNPASLAGFDNACLGISYQFETEINPVVKSTIFNRRKRWNNLLPHSIGFVYVLNNTRFGFGINQKFNMHLQIGPYESSIISDNEDGFDTVEIASYEKTSIIRGALLLSHSLNQIFHSSDKLTFGIKYNFFHLNSEIILFNENYSNELNSQGFAAGFKYENQFNTDLIFSAAFYCEKGTKLKDLWNIYERIQYPDTVNLRSYLIGIVPDKIDLGFMLQFQRLSLLLNASFIFWQNYSIDDPRYTYNIKNQLELNGSIIYDVYEKCKISLGFYNTDFKPSIPGVQGYNNINDYSAFFLTGGVVFDISDFQIDLAVADSHLFSPELRKQTIFKMGVNYFLPGF